MKDGSAVLFAALFVAFATGFAFGVHHAVVRVFAAEVAGLL